MNTINVNHEKPFFILSIKLVSVVSAKEGDIKEDVTKNYLCTFW